MCTKKIAIMLSVFALTFFSFNATATNLIRFYSDHDAYYLVPPSRIIHIDIDVDDNEATIYIDNNKSVLRKVNFEDIPEKEALELVESIYSVTRKEILNVKVHSFN